MTDLLANAINNIKTSETVGKDACIVPNTKLVKAVVGLMKENNYIKEFEEFYDNNVPLLKVILAKKINGIGVVRPRFPVKLDEYQKYEMRYIPSKDFGMLIVSTSKGIMTNRAAKEMQVGGRLLAYVY
jgi:small subunit ribosomal protein S8